MRGRVAQKMPLPAPIGGLNGLDSLSEMPPTDAIKMVNAFPSEDAVTVRKGHEVLLGGVSSPLKTIMIYDAGVTPNIFVAGGGKIARFDGSYTVLSKEGILNDLLSHVNFGTPAGRFLFCTNGKNVPFYYNGTVWADSAITGTDLNPADLDNVTIFKNRLFFTQNNSLSFWYLDLQSISGTAKRFDLSSLFSRGGYLIGIVTISLDAGDGLDDIIVFISNKGQAVFYQGDNPNSADSWAMVASVNISTMINKRFFAKVGSDALLLTSQGIVSLLQIYQDESNAKKNSVGRKINPFLVKDIQANFYSDEWRIYYNDVLSRVYVNVPNQNNTATKQYVMNEKTGAWCVFEGISLADMAHIDNNFYAVYKDQILKLESGILDKDNPILVDVHQAYVILGVSDNKSIKGVQPFFFFAQKDITSEVLFDIVFDFGKQEPTNQIYTIIDNLPIWGSAIWGVTPIVRQENYYNDYNSLGGKGNYLSLRLKMQSRYKEFKWHSSIVHFEVCNK